MKTKHVNKHRDNRGSTGDIYSQYLGQLKRGQLKQLCDLYELDFDILGYDSSECEPFFSEIRQRKDKERKAKLESESHRDKNL